MRAFVVPIALPLVLTAPAFAQQSGDSQQQAPGQQVQQQTAVQPGSIPARIRQNPQAAGVTDSRSMPGFFLARAKDTDGNTVLMLVNPDTGEAIPVGIANRQPQQQPQQQQALQQQPQQQQQQLQQAPPQQQALQQQRGPQKTIGHPQTEVVPSLIVFNAGGASLQGGKLVLIGVSPNTIVFADRPTRAAGQDLTAHIIDDWANGSENFANDPPNATVSEYNKEGGNVRDAVVLLKTAKLEGDHLTFDVDVLEGDLTGADGPAALFIDIAGRPLTPMSIARRGAWYASAAAPGVGAAASNGAYAACGRYPYPPCY
jgi:hypothetical protein